MNPAPTPRPVLPTAAGFVDWPDELATRYRRNGHWDGVAIGDRFAAAAAAAPDSVAVIDGERVLTYAQLLEAVDRTAGRLLASRLLPDDRIVVQLPTCAEFVIVTLACLRAGIVPVMAMVAHREHELTHMAEVAEARAIIVPREVKGFDHRALAHGVVARIPTLEIVFVLGHPQHGDIDPSDIDLGALIEESGGRPEPGVLPAVAGSAVAVLLLSGGTTGLPKLIPRTHDDYSYCSRRMAEVAGIAADSVYLVTLPPGHNFPLTGILGTLFAQGMVVTQASPEPTKAFATIGRNGVTHAAVVPAVAKRWLDHEDTAATGQLRSMQVLQVGGSRFPDDLARRVRPLTGAVLQQVFGMAEGLVCMTRLDDPEEVICTTQGRPICVDDEVLIVDEAGDPVPDGEPGSLLTRGPYTLRGYYRGGEHNTRSFREGGWYASGDIVLRRQDSNVVVLGRDKDVINRGGEKISAEEIEGLVYRIDAVDAAAAISMPDPVLGERLCLCVALRPGTALTLEEVRAALVDAGIATYKLPERLEVLPTLPITKVGKIDKKTLRGALVAERAPGGAR